MSQNNQGNLLNTSNNSITANPLSDTFQNQKKSVHSLNLNFKRRGRIPWMNARCTYHSYLRKGFHS